MTALAFASLPGDARAQLRRCKPALQAYADDLASPSRRTIGDVVAALIDGEHPNVSEFLRRYSQREVVQRPEDGLFFYAEDVGGLVRLVDIDSGEAVAEVSSRDVKQIRTNSGVQRVIAAALVPLELIAPERERRLAALDAIGRSPDASQIAPLADSIATETDAALQIRKERLLLLLQAQFAEDRAVQLAAIEALGGDTRIEARRVLNRLTATVTEVAPELPEAANIARVLNVGDDLTESAAYDLLVNAGLADPAQTPAMLREVLAQNIVDGRVGGVPIGRLSDPAARIAAYEALEAAGTVPPRAAPDEAARAVAAHVFFTRYTLNDPEITATAQAALDSTRQLIASYQLADLVLDGLSLASIFFLAAIGLAITFGVMGVIKHGAWRIHHDGGLYRLCGAIVHPRLHDQPAGRLATGIPCHLRRGRGDGTQRDTPPLYPPAGNAAGNFRHFDCAATACQEHLRHAGAPPDRARLAGRGAAVQRHRRHQHHSRGDFSCWR